MLSEQRENTLSTGLACAALQPALRSILIFDAPFAGLQQVARQLIEIARYAGQKLRPVVLGTTERDDDLWGEGLLPDRQGEIRSYTRIFAPPRNADETLLVIIPDLSALSLAAARAGIMLVGAHVAHLERHSQQSVWSPRYYWLAACRQEMVGAVSPHLLDRFALRLSWVSAENLRLTHQERVSLLQDALQQTPVASLPKVEPELLQRVEHASKHSPLIEITQEACELIMEYQEGDVFHQRRELALARCAIALAGLEDETSLQESHVEQAANLMGLRKPVSDEADLSPDTPDMSNVPRAEPSAPVPASQLPSGAATRQPDRSPNAIEVQTQEPNEQRMVEYVMAAVQPYPEDTEPVLREAASLQIPLKRGIGMRSDRGPIIGVEVGTSLRDLALVHTLMQALLYQAFRRAPGSTEIVLDWTDLRTYRRAAEPERLLLLLLDYTCMPLEQRQRELVPYLSKAYIDRASITIIKVGATASETKSGLRAESVSARSILVPSISDAIDALPGNATPLAHGLELAFQVMQRSLQHGRSAMQQITFVVVSDGRGNVPLEASHSNIMTKSVAREGVEDALTKARELGKVKYVSSIVIAPNVRYYADLPQRLADALKAELFISKDEKDGGMA